MYEFTGAVVYRDNQNYIKFLYTETLSPIATGPIFVRYRFDCINLHTG